MTGEGIFVSALVVATTLGREWLHEIKSRRLDQESLKRDAEIAHIKKVGDDIHLLSNSAMSIALKDNAVTKHAVYVLTKRLAVLTSSVEDQAAVEVAQSAWVTAEKFSSKHEVLEK